VSTARKPRSGATQIIARLDALTLKERVLIATSVLLSVALGWHALLLEPLDVRKRALVAEIATGADACSGWKRSAMN
jgi:hypothetical protein